MTTTVPLKDGVLRLRRAYGKRYVTGVLLGTLGIVLLSILGTGSAHWSLALIVLAASGSAAYIWQQNNFTDMAYMALSGAATTLALVLLFIFHQSDANVFLHALVLLTIATATGWSTGKPVIAASAIAAVSYAAFAFLSPEVLAPMGAPLPALAGCLAIIAAAAAYLSYLANRELNTLLGLDRLILESEGAHAMIEDFAETSRELAEREQNRRQELQKIITEFDLNFLDTLDSVLQSIRQLKETAGDMSEIASSANTDAVTAAGRSDVYSRNARDVAAAISQLSAAISEIDKEVVAAQRVVGVMSHGAEEANKVVDVLDVAIQRVDSIVGLIQTIAEKTNLLALNATIEAARAGEYGRGFAVVASEVKTLAQQTASATQDVTAQIAEIKGATNSAISNIRALTTSMQEIDQRTHSIAAAVEQQDQVTQSINRNIAEVAAGGRDLATVTGNMQQSADKTTQAASDLLAAAEALDERSSGLETAVHQLLQKVASA